MEMKKKTNLEKGLDDITKGRVISEKEFKRIYDKKKVRLDITIDEEISNEFRKRFIRKKEDLSNKIQFLMKLSTTLDKISKDENYD